ncbi:16095_t:CDS:2, partial [Racocetra fulgida]
KSRLPLYNSFFPELIQIQTHLEDFSLCEKHYNQLIVSDFLRQVLTNANYSQLSKNKRQAHSLDFENELVEKQAHIEHAYEIEVEKNTCETGTQTDEIGNKITREIGIQVSDNMSHTLENYIHLLQAQLSIKINEIENLQKQLEYAYDYVIENNKKHTCPQCNEKLDTLATLQAESTEELTQVDNSKTSQSGTPIIKIYEYA